MSSRVPSAALQDYLAASASRALIQDQRALAVPDVEAMTVLTTASSGRCSAPGARDSRPGRPRRSVPGARADRTAPTGRRPGASGAAPLSPGPFGVVRGMPPALADHNRAETFRDAVARRYCCARAAMVGARAAPPRTTTAVSMSPLPGRYAPAAREPVRTTTGTWSPDRRATSRANGPANVRACSAVMTARRADHRRAGDQGAAAGAGDPAACCAPATVWAASGAARGGRPGTRLRAAVAPWAALARRPPRLAGGATGASR